MRFRGQIQDAFMFRERKGLVLSLTNIEGLPEIGMHVSILGEIRKIIEIGRNSTDGNAVSYRSCLTGQPVPAYGSIGVDWNESDVDAIGLRDQWVEEETQ